MTIYDPDSLSLTLTQLRTLSRTTRKHGLIRATQEARKIWPQLNLKQASELIKNEFKADLEDFYRARRIEDQKLEASPEAAEWYKNRGY